MKTRNALTFSLWVAVAASCAAFAVWMVQYNVRKLTALPAVITDTNGGFHLSDGSDGTARANP